MTTTYYTRVHKISPTGELLWTQSQEVTSQPTTKSIAVPINGGCVVQIDDNTINAFASDGTALWENDSFSNIINIEVGENGMIYVLDLSGLHKLDQQGNINWTNTDLAIA